MKTERKAHLRIGQPAWSLILSGAVVAAASIASAGPLFEDPSPRAQELRTQPGIEITQTPAPARPVSPIQAFGMLGPRTPSRRQPDLQAPTQSMPQADAEASTSTLTEVERRRIEAEADARFRPVLQSAIRGARILGLPEPVLKDGTPVEPIATPQAEPRGQVERVARGAEALKDAASSARELMKNRLAKLQNQADGMEDESTTTSETAKNEATDTATTDTSSGN